MTQDQNLALRTLLMKAQSSNVHLLSILRELFWCKDLYLVSVMPQNHPGPNTPPEKQLIFSGLESLQAWKAQAQAQFVSVTQKSNGAEAFAALLNSASELRQESINLEIDPGTPHGLFLEGFDPIALYLVRSNIFLESELLRTRQDSAYVPDPQALWTHPGVDVALVPVSLLLGGSSTNKIPGLIKLDSGATAVTCYTGPEHLDVNRAQLVKDFGDQVEFLRIPGEDLAKFVFFQPQMREIAAGVLLNPFSDAELFLSWDMIDRLKSQNAA